VHPGYRGWCQIRKVMMKSIELPGMMAGSGTSKNSTQKPHRASSSQARSMHVSELMASDCRAADARL
jgi:hypothetical protein